MHKINGQPADHIDACKSAAQILRNTSLPLIAGLSTDVAGAKAALALAKTTGGIIDHLASDSIDREMKLLSYTGGFTTTSGEARNRADVILVIGKAPLIRESDLIKRLFPTGDRLPHMGDSHRALILLGGRSDQLPTGVDFHQIEGSHVGLETSLSCISAYMLGRPVSEASLGDDVASKLKHTAEKLKKARYAVIVYSPAELSEPAIHCIRDLVNNLNNDNRAASLAIAGRDNIIGVSQTCSWTTGFPLRTSFARGYPEYNPHLFETTRLLRESEVDALLWVSSLTKSAPPNTNEGIPQIIIGIPGVETPKEPDIYIEVGEPGLDHDGAIYRPEYGAIVTVHQKDIGKTELPTVASVLKSIAEEYAKLGAQ